MWRSRAIHADHRRIDPAKCTLQSAIAHSSALFLTSRVMWTEHHEGMNVIDRDMGMAQRITDSLNIVPANRAAC